MFFNPLCVSGGYFSSVLMVRPGESLYDGSKTDVTQTIVIVYLIKLQQYIHTYITHEINSKFLYKLSMKLLFNSFKTVLTSILDN